MDRESRLRASHPRTASLRSEVAGGAPWAVPAETLPELADLVPHGTLGEGGMGVVGLAYQTSLARDVAVKTPHEGACSASRRALVQEALILGALEHPNIVPVHALAFDGRGRPMLVMKRVRGVPWRALIGDPGHPQWKALGGSRLEFHLDVFRQVCNAAHFAHTRSIVHRDIKSDNVMIGDCGEVYLVDWGLAVRLDALAMSAQIVGTPSYMAPEMLLGTGPWLGPHTDVYLLGAVLHEVLTGTTRHPGGPDVEMFGSIRESEPVAYPAEVPAALAALCNEATARRPHERPATAQALREGVDRYLEERASHALADRSRVKLAALTVLCGERGADPAAVYAALGQCLQACSQSLLLWPDNPEPAQRIDDARAAVAGWELDHRRLGPAETLVRQLRTPPSALVARLDALRAEHRAIARELKRFRLLERARRRARVALAALGAVTQPAVILALGAVAQAGRLHLRLWHMAALLLVEWLALVVFAMVWREPAETR